MTLPIWLPNAITTLRIALLAIGSALMTSPAHFDLGLVTAVVGCVTDRLDGFIARRFKLGTEFGKIYDQQADKIGGIFLMGMMVSLAVIPIWVMVAILLRDYLVSLIRDFALLKYQHVIQASTLGKRKTEINAFGTLSLLLLHRAGMDGGLVGVTVVGVALAANYISLLDYWMRARRLRTIAAHRRG